MAVDAETGPETVDTTWKESALCTKPETIRALGLRTADEVGDVFFSVEPKDIAKAKAVCETPCPVKAECLDFALTGKEPYGVFGGVDMKEHWATQGETPVQVIPPTPQ